MTGPFASTGKQLWQKPAPPVEPMFHTAQSALVDRGVVILHTGGHAYTHDDWITILPLDRIYAGPPAVLRDFSVHRSPLARLASDHLPLRARLAWG